MDRRAWRAPVHGVAKSRTRPKPLSIQAPTVKALSPKHWTARELSHLNFFVWLLLESNFILFFKTFSFYIGV